jgi:hypothetical protein
MELIKVSAVVRSGFPLQPESNCTISRVSAVKAAISSSVNNWYDWMNANCRRALERRKSLNASANSRSRPSINLYVANRAADRAAHGGKRLVGVPAQSGNGTDADHDDRRQLVGCSLNSSLSDGELERLPH